MRHMKKTGYMICVAVDLELVVACGYSFGEGLEYRHRLLASCLRRLVVWVEHHIADDDRA